MDEAAERIATNIRKGVLEFCVLSLLSRRAMYGLELANELIERGLTASDGSLYPLLARMSENQLVTSEWSTPETGRARRYYAITADGTAHLATFTAVWGDMSTHITALLTEENT